MEQVEVKSLATKVGRIGFGCDPLGEYGWGALDRSAMAAAIHVALDSGIDLFDISDAYGLGRAELTLGEALVGKRSRAVIVSKFGVRMEDGRGTFYDNSVACACQRLGKAPDRVGCTSFASITLPGGRTSTPSFR